MKEENKKCWSCGYYRPLYTRGWNVFCKQEIGLCSKHHNNVISSGECCEKWNCLLQLKSVRKQRAIDSIAEILAKITAIAETIKEYEQLDNINNE